MASLTNSIGKFFGSAGQFFVKPNTGITVSCRYASKKTGSTTQNAGNAKAKHRGWKCNDGCTVHRGNILATQNKTRWHPGLNVLFGRNGNLVAMVPGKVVVTCEKINPNWDHTWIMKNYGERKGQTIYKKHFNVIPTPQHNRFKLVDKI